MEVISRLCAWYVSNCENDWHEDYGIKIDTIDNPGWSVKVDLIGTNLISRKFEEKKIDRSDSDWVFCRVNNNLFESYGGAMNLGEMIEIFLAWAE